MAFQIDCPNCGVRPVGEFHYGGSVGRRPEPAADIAEWAEYLFHRTNTCGLQTEWWFHRSACKLWFLAERDTRTNQVTATRTVTAAEALRD